MLKRQLIPLNTVPEVVAAFGRTKAMAEWCGIGMSNISDWLADKHIPASWHYRLDREARRRGYLINPKVFGEKPDPDEVRLLHQAKA
jgi:hypothetical protein